MASLSPISRSRILVHNSVEIWVLLQSYKYPVEHLGLVAYSALMLQVATSCVIFSSPMELCSVFGVTHFEPEHCLGR